MEEARGGGKVARGGRDGRYGGIPPNYHIGKAGGGDPGIRLPQPEDSMAAKKTTSKKQPGKRRKAATPKGAGKKPASRKTAARKEAGRKPTGRKTTAKTASARRRRVATAVKATARRGLDAAKEGFGRIKSATTHLVEAARDRLAGDEPAPG